MLSSRSGAEQIELTARRETNVPVPVTVSALTADAVRIKRTVAQTIPNISVSEPDPALNQKLFYIWQLAAWLPIYEP